MLLEREAALFCAECEEAVECDERGVALGTVTAAAVGVGGVFDNSTLAPGNSTLMKRWLPF